LDPEFGPNNPEYGRKRVALWRERIFCAGKHGCQINKNPSDTKHKKCSVEIVCTIFADAPTMMEIRYKGDHGPQYKPPPSIDLLGRKLTYQVPPTLSPIPNTLKFTYHSWTHG
jgi:hypothetical protein